MFWITVDYKYLSSFWIPLVPDSHQDFSAYKYSATNVALGFSFLHVYFFSTIKHEFLESKKHSINPWRPVHTRTFTPAVILTHSPQNTVQTRECRVIRPEGNLSVKVILIQRSPITAEPSGTHSTFHLGKIALEGRNFYLLTSSDPRGPYFLLSLRTN